MSVRDKHVPVERLTAMAFVAHAPQADADHQAVAHISGCDWCAGELARLTVDADGLREAAYAEADAAFDDVALEMQRSRILDRLAHLGQAARVLRFPLTARAHGLPTGTGSRRWISVAAAAGLIIGLLAGQLLHFVPWQAADRITAAPVSIRQSAPAIVPTATITTASLSDDELLDAIEAAVQFRRGPSLRALDALTPTAGDQYDPSLGR
jgi:hypothetical protein